MNKMHRNLLISCLSVFFVIVSPGQRIKQELLMAKAGFDTCEIHAYQYSDSQIVAQVNQRDIYSASGLLIRSVLFDASGKITWEMRKQVSPDGLKTTKTQLNHKGEVYNIEVYQGSSDQKKIFYYKINLGGDTIVSQYRILNNFGFDSVCYTKDINEVYQRSSTYKYDSIGRIIFMENMGDFKTMEFHHVVECQYVGGRDCYLQICNGGFSRICMVNMVDTIFYGGAASFYEYGIAFEKQSGGKEIIKYRKDGLIDERIIYSPQGAIINRVKYTYR
jgi:hypothetical protein